MSDSRERRDVPSRYKIAIFIVDGGETVPFGVTRDLNRTGMFVQTKERPPIDALTTISFVWGEDTFSAQARVVRHEETGVGVAFIEPEEFFLQALDEIVGDS